MKTCNGCGQEFPDSCYSRRGDGRGLRSRCRACRSAEWNRTNKELRRLDPESARQKDAEYRRVNRESILQRGREAYRSDPERFRATRRRYYERHAEAERARQRAYHEAHKAEANEYVKKRYREQPRYNVVARFRASLSQALRRGSRSLRTETLLGCTVVEFCGHLESRFSDAGPHPVTGEAMSWENRHLWQIDHIIPCASFPNLANDTYQQRRCFHYLNQQPLWRVVNQSKGATIVGYKRLRHS